MTGAARPAPRCGGLRGHCAQSEADCTVVYVSTGKAPVARARWSPRRVELRPARPAKASARRHNEAMSLAANPPLGLSMLMISLGGAAGAVARWLLAQALNALFPAIPPGTLVANLVGGYLIGVALAVFAQHPGLAPEWRLLLVTGFLGGLTTFSTFSAEVTVLLQQGRLAWAGLAIGAHVLGSLLMTLLGMATVNAVWRH